MLNLFVQARLWLQHNEQQCVILKRVQDDDDLERNA
jgi:hypothetical protein